MFFIWVVYFLAEKAFKDVGTYLQRLRREDYWDTFSIYLENADEDPAVEDKELADQLKLNKELGEKRLNDMFDEFAKRQEGLGADEDVASDDAENENEDEEEEEEDDNDDDLLDVATEKKTEVEKSKVDLIEEKSCEREETGKISSSKDICEGNKEVEKVRLDDVLEVDKKERKRSDVENGNSEVSKSTFVEVQVRGGVKEQPVVRVRAFAKYTSPQKSGEQTETAIRLSNKSTNSVPPMVKIHDFSIVDECPATVLQHNDKQMICSNDVELLGNIIIHD